MRVGCRLWQVRATAKMTRKQSMVKLHARVHGHEDALRGDDSFMANAPKVFPSLFVVHCSLFIAVVAAAVAAPSSLFPSC